ncbi:MAG: hypothetical protein J0L57_07210, partial [Burkholderiales bacterium]|nr:hypothetical protein [Burkholderiales bacterium]
MPTPFGIAAPATLTFDYNNLSNFAPMLIGSSTSATVAPVTTLPLTALVERLLARLGNTPAARDRLAVPGAPDGRSGAAPDGHPAAAPP